MLTSKNLGSATMGTSTSPVKARGEAIPKISVEEFVNILLEDCEDGMNAETGGPEEELVQAVLVDTEFYANMLAEAYAEG